MHCMVSFTISSNTFLLMPRFSKAFMCLSNFHGPKGTASSGQTCPQPRTSHQSPGASSPCPGDPTAAGPVSITLQPCPARDLSPASACPRAASIPPGCSAHGWGSGTVPGYHTLPGCAQGSPC